jgi:hypothetical protein
MVGRSEISDVFVDFHNNFSMAFASAEKETKILVQTYLGRQNAIATSKRLLTHCEKKL